jgi:hypothetical protein
MCAAFGAAQFPSHLPASQRHIGRNQEIARVARTCQPKPVIAGLGIGVPGGEEAETVEGVTAWTEACYDGGAAGILLSRHYHEMRPEFLRAAGEVINRRLKTAVTA